MSIELNNVFVYSLAILHHEVSQLMLRITLWVMWAKVSDEFAAELDVIVHPLWVRGMRASEKVRLEPVKHST